MWSVYFITYEQWFHDLNHYYEVEEQSTVEIYRIYKDLCYTCLFLTSIKILLKKTLRQKQAIVYREGGGGEGYFRNPWLALLAYRDTIPRIVIKMHSVNHEELKAGWCILNLTNILPLSNQNRGKSIKTFAFCFIRCISHFLQTHITSIKVCANM